MKNKAKYILIISTLLISILGIIMITSSSYIWSSYKYNDSFKYMKNQLIFFIIGIFLMYLISKINYTKYKKYSTYIFLTILVLLILVLIPGIGSLRNGSRSWFKIGPFGVQPSEFMKLGIIIFISKYIVNNRKEVKKIKGIIPVMFVISVVFFIIMLQPDFGTGIVIIMISLSLLFVGEANTKFFIGIFIIGIALITILILIAPYRLDRILSYLNPWKDPLGTGFQIIQSMYAIGPSGILGFGLGNSKQKHFYLPEPQTDFIYSIICEELGFLGALLVVILFVTIIISIIHISKHTDDLFGKYLSFGIAFYIGFQSILNLMVVVGLIPVTGEIINDGK